MAARLSAPQILAGLRHAGWRWRQRLGLPGLVALALALAAALLLAAGLARLATLADEQARLQQALRSAGQPRPAPAPTAAGLAASQLERLPPLAQRPDDIAQLMAAMRTRGLQDMPTRYRVLEARSPGIERLEITLEGRQGYEAWRALIVDLLNRLPNAAISGASWARSEIESDQSEARLGIVLYHRRAP
ncbi:conserved hypothetical protein [Rubrivivax sp. A210]|uniref:hypothetical protein n=1 Tax=Rubrivivax sp. A210 TaxID=2772301 RepID=UPI001917E387|nr:hypothetical protein [Rubrivivax sp. A210]CAD5371583.1 conserved hypothetical protein [Rubrivivax sp. A210]